MIQILASIAVAYISVALSFTELNPEKWSWWVSILGMLSAVLWYRCFKSFEPGQKEFEDGR